MFQISDIVLAADQSVKPFKFILQGFYLDFKSTFTIFKEFTRTFVETLGEQLMMAASAKMFKELYPPNFFKKIIFGFLIFFWYFKLWRIPLCYLFLLFRTFYASLFHYKIDSLEEYSLATDIATSFTCFKPQYYTRKSSFYLFSMVENPVKPRITKSRKNLDKQDKIDLEKQTLSSALQKR